MDLFSEELVTGPVICVCPMCRREKDKRLVYSHGLGFRVNEPSEAILDVGCLIFPESNGQHRAHEIVRGELVDGC